MNIIIKNQNGLRVKFYLLFYIEYKCFSLNYRGRTIRQSIKNFQIYSKDENENEDLVMQFGRTSDLCFILDFKYPFSILQAFAFALSSIDRK